jgi:hypothetical protein
MSTIIYGGVKYVKIRHALYCKKCNDTIISYDIHDYKLCSCGAIGIDGGIYSGNSLIGSLLDMEDRSMYCAMVNGKRLWLPQDVINNNFKDMIKILWDINKK